MNKELNKLKLLHTIIWGLFVAVFLYIAVALVNNWINIILYICFLLIIIETIVLLLNKWKCPITLSAEKHTDKTSVGFDIYLPKWLAKNNKLIFSIIFVIEVAFLIIKTFL